MKKKIFALVALFLCALGTAFAGGHLKNKMELYSEFEQLARSYQYVYILETDTDGVFYREGDITVDDFDDDIEFVSFSAKYDTVFAVFANDTAKAEKEIENEMGEAWYHWRRIPLSGGYAKALTYFKTLIEVCE